VRSSSDRGSSSSALAHGLPASHVVDVVQITGCDNNILAAHYRNPLSPWWVPCMVRIAAYGMHCCVWYPLQGMVCAAV
jgi:hypothetical protein